MSQFIGLPKLHQLCQHVTEALQSTAWSVSVHFATYKHSLEKGKSSKKSRGLLLVLNILDRSA